MNTTQLIGEVAFTEQPAETSFQSGRGWSATRKWTGVRSQLINFIVSGLPGFYSDLRIEEDGEKATVIATYGIVGIDGNNQVSDPVSVVWTMPNNEADLLLYELPDVQALFLQIGDASATSLAAEIEDGIQNHTRMDKVDWEAFVLTPDQLVIAQALYARLMRRIDTFRVSQYVLRKVQTVIAQSQLKAAHENVNRYFDHGKLVATEPTLPAAALIDAAGLTQYFWIKKTPVVDSTNRGQFQISQEYWGFESIDPFVYKPAI